MFRERETDKERDIRIAGMREARQDAKDSLKEAKRKAKERSIKVY